MCLKLTIPIIALWVKQYGWIEIGYADYRHHFIRVLDDGGLIWESQKEIQDRGRSIASTRNRTDAVDAPAGIH